MSAETPASTWRSALAPELPRLVELRHQLHANPELSFEERETSALVLRELQGLGLEIRTGLAKGTGIVAVLKGTAPGADSAQARVVALRADMDALPIQEQNQFAYASKVPGKMHACGHDGHTASLLGAAKVLAQHRARLKGQVVFCFQPAEENGGGGRYMVNEGALDHPACSAAFAQHGISSLPLGHVGVRSGPSHAASDALRIVVRGQGGHGAAPHLSVDPIVLGARVIEALQSVVSREVNPVDSAVITIGAVHAGTARNVIPEHLEMLGTIRSLKAGVRKSVHAAVRRTAEGICAAGGGAAEVEITDGYPVMVNDPQAAAFACRVAEEIVGKDHTRELQQPTMGGEDFGFFLQKVPGCMFRVGVATRDDYPGLHHPLYDYSDEALPVAVAMFCRIAERYLEEGF